MDGQDWDFLLPYVLLAIQDVPQASTAFTPFESLFRRWQRGLLDIAQEAWEEQPSSFCSVVEFIREKQEQIDHVSPIVNEHLLTTQEKQR